MAEFFSTEGIILNAITFSFDKGSQVLKLENPIDIASIDIVDGKVTINFTYKKEDLSLSAKKFFDMVQELVQN